MKSFWVISSRIVVGVRWYWYIGIMEYNMTNALRRFLGHVPLFDRLTYHSPQYWTYDAGTVENPNDWFEVFQQEDQPPLVNDKTAMINDMREYDLFKQRVQPAPRPGFKKLPEVLC